MEKWPEVFDIVDVTILSDCRRCKGEMRFMLVEKRSCRVLGIYVDVMYAYKQARYKHKKMLKQLEQILLVG